MASVQTHVTEATLFSPLRPLWVPELWNDGLHSRKNKKKDPFCAVKKKKPVVVSDILQAAVIEFLSSFISSDISHRCFTLTALSRPYIVYMLQDLDILEDWTAIRKVFRKDTVMVWCLCSDLICLLLPPVQAMASLGPHRAKVDGKLHSIAGWVQPSTDWEGSIQYFLFLPPYFCFPFVFFPSSSRTEAWQTPPRGAVRGRPTFLWQPVVLQGTGHLHQQEGWVPD